MAVGHYEKRLEGVKTTEGLQRLLEKAAESSLSSLAAADGAVDKLHQFLQHPKGDCIPIDIVQAMHDVLLAKGANDDSSDLDKALRSTRLVFTAPPLALDDMAANDDASLDGHTHTEKDATNLSLEERKFRQRMQRLRFKNEETKYAKLTSNLKMNAVQDDVTTKSMTYAASIGLNMIVAPISFGVFMYFFAGSLLDYVWPRSISPHSTHTPVDIKKVIVGVVSGVAMLFIEMLLFVIRTHEMDKAMRKKYKKKPSPFGHYSSESAKSYHHHDD